MLLLKMKNEFKYWFFYFQFSKPNLSINVKKNSKISPSGSLVASGESIAENLDHSKLEVIASPTIVGEISMISLSV